VVALAAAAPRLSPRGRTVTREVRAPTRDAPTSVSAVPLCMAEALATLALHRALWSHVRLTDTCRPQSLVIERNLDTLGPCATDTMTWVWRAVLIGVLVTMAGTQLRDPLDMNAQGLELLPDDALRHAKAQILHQQPRTAVLWELEGVETHLPPSKDRSALTVALKPLAVDGTTISLSALIWAVRPPGQEGTGVTCT